MARFFGCLVALLLAMAVRPASAQPLNLTDLLFDPLITGLDRPVAVTHAGDGSGRLFVTLQAGRIVVLDGGRLLDIVCDDLLHFTNVEKRRGGSSRHSPGGS